MPEVAPCSSSVSPTLSGPGRMKAGTAVALAIALMVGRLKGWVQSLVLAAFFLPFILPVTVVYLIWDWLMNFQFGIAQHIGGRRRIAVIDGDADRGG